VACYARGQPGFIGFASFVVRVRARGRKLKLPLGLILWYPILCASQLKVPQRRSEAGRPPEGARRSVCAGMTFTYRRSMNGGKSTMLHLAPKPSAAWSSSGSRRRSEIARTSHRDETSAPSPIHAGPTPSPSPPDRDWAQGEGEMKSAPGLKGRAWTAEDDERLKSLMEASVSVDFIAAKLKRTTKGVKSRAHALGISTKRVWVGPKAKK
jgi:hypothetical protein